MPSRGVCADSGPSEEPVVLATHDPSWSSKFETEKAAIANALGAAAIEVHHIGSTAVPGLAAKPVIDILVAVDSLEGPVPLVEALSSLGYLNVPHDDDVHRLFFRKGVPRAYHVHAVKLNSWTYWKHLMFRDILVSNPEVRAEYGRLKSELASRFRSDRKAYTDAKGEFVERTVAERARGR
jgi:GrpB-like predicted nucleotidyltransferase (UPF0157 family)